MASMNLFLQDCPSVQWHTHRQRHDHDDNNDNDYDDDNTDNDDKPDDWLRRLRLSASSNRAFQEFVDGEEFGCGFSG